MISRVTQQSAQRSVLANMQKNLSAMAKLQEQASSGRKSRRSPMTQHAHRTRCRYVRNVPPLSSTLVTLRMGCRG